MKTRAIGLLLVVGLAVGLASCAHNAGPQPEAVDVAQCVAENASPMVRPVTEEVNALAHGSTEDRIAASLELATLVLARSLSVEQCIRLATLRRALQAAGGRDGAALLDKFHVAPARIYRVDVVPEFRSSQHALLDDNSPLGVDPHVAHVGCDLRHAPAEQHRHRYQHRLSHPRLRSCALRRAPRDNLHPGAWRLQGAS